MNTRIRLLSVSSVVIIVLIAGLLSGYYWYVTRETSSDVKLSLLYDGDSLLFNPYGVILVNPALHPSTHFYQAAEFVKWLISSEGQELIDNYTMLGVQLFHSNFDSSLLNASEKAFWNNITVGSSDSTTIVLATTTSTRDSGLLDYLLPKFYERSKIRIDVVAVGTGAALDTARQGNADVVMVHARSLEDEFIAEGHGVHRVDLMYNDFVIIGPQTDPARVMDASSAVDAFLRIYHARSTFISRGDNSGTNVKELSIWFAANVTINPEDSTWQQKNQWYIESGQGMSATLTMAYEMQGYTLSDRATWITFRVNFQG